MDLSFEAKDFKICPRGLHYEANPNSNGTCKTQKEFNEGQFMISKCVYGFVTFVKRCVMPSLENNRDAHPFTG